MLALLIVYCSSSGSDGIMSEERCLPHTQGTACRQAAACGHHFGLVLLHVPGQAADLGGAAVS